MQHAAVPSDGQLLPHPENINKSAKKYEHPNATYDSTKSLVHVLLEVFRISLMWNWTLSAISAETVHKLENIS